MRRLGPVMRLLGPAPGDRRGEVRAIAGGTGPHRDRDPAPGGAVADGRPARCGGAPVLAGDRGRPAQFDRSGRPGASRARTRRRAEAYQLRAEALEIDPDNAAAQRLVARLGEVDAPIGATGADGADTGVEARRADGCVGADWSVGSDGSRRRGRRCGSGRRRRASPCRRRGPRRQRRYAASITPRSKRRGLFGRILGR